MTPAAAQRVRDAARYRKDRGLSRLSQRRAARLLRASAKAEKRFEGQCRQLARALHAGVAQHLAGDRLNPTVERAAGGARQDAKPLPTHDLKRRLFVYVQAHLPKAFDAMAGTVSKDNAAALQLLGISPAVVPGMGAMLNQARADAVARLQDSGGKYIDQVTEILEDPENFGLRAEELQALLEERGEVLESSAAFLARDTTLRTNATVNKLRQTAAGVEAYRWSTSKDERVRPMHKALEGEKFDWDDPPVTNEDGDTNAPGEDYQCRCVPLPVIPELEGGSEEDEPEEGDEVA